MTLPLVLEVNAVGMSASELQILKAAICNSFQVQFQLKLSGTRNATLYCRHANLV